MQPFSNTGSDAVPRRWPVRLILVGVVFALVLPGLLFAGVLVDRIARVERARAEDGVAAASLRAAEAMDRELANIAAALRALATSPALAAGDIPTFAMQARAIATPDQAFVLADGEGRQLINTRRPVGEPLPRMADLATLQTAIRTGRTTASNLFVGAVSREPAIVVMHPIMLRSETPAVLVMNLRPSFLSELLKAQGLPAGWIGSLLDGNDRIIARTLNPEGTLGHYPSPTTREPFPGERTLRTGVTLEGEPVLIAMQCLRLADWRVAIGVSLRTVEAPLHATLRWLTVTGLIALAIAGLMAWQLAHSVARPLHRLARAGTALAGGLPVLGVRSSIAEVDSVSRALVQATRDLHARADALATERAQLAAVIETVPVGLLIALANGRIVSGNTRLEAMLRHKVRNSASTAEYGEWVARHEDGRLVQGHEYPLARALAGEAAPSLKCRYECGDGTRLWISIAAAPIRDATGTITGGVAAVLDIDEVMHAREAQNRFSERLEHQVAERTAAVEAANQRLRDEMAARAAAEEQLHQAQKMEAVGQLTGGIAHDFNNLLTIVMGNLDLLRRRAQDDRTKRLLDNALEGSTRAATLTARLLAFSRRQPLLPQPLDLNRLVTGMSDLMHRTLGEAVQLETILAGGVWQTHADPNQLENALLNLAVNGRDALREAQLANHGASHGPPAPGRLVIATGNVTLDASFAPHDPEFHPGDYVRVSVSDDGAGMPPEVLARVFEPFFTTKPLGQGTGLGLSQVHGFVKQSGGIVTIDTAPGQGTTVAIHLPRMAAQQDAAPATAEHGDEPGPAGLTVLVLEDDAGVRRFSAEALRELGHIVLETGGGEEALRLLDAHPGIDLLLTDVVLPGMSGPAVAIEARRRHPALPVLFASGYTGDDSVNGLLPPGASLLHKPYTIQALSAKLATVLGHTPEERPELDGAPGRT